MKNPCPDGHDPDGTEDLTTAELDLACGGVNTRPMTRPHIKAGIIVDDGAPIKEYS